VQRGTQGLVEFIEAQRDPDIDHNFHSSQWADYCRALLWDKLIAENPSFASYDFGIPRPEARADRPEAREDESDKESSTVIDMKIDQVVTNEFEQQWQETFEKRIHRLATWLNRHRSEKGVGFALLREILGHMGEGHQLGTVTSNVVSDPAVFLRAARMIGDFFDSVLNQRDMREDNEFQTIGRWAYQEKLAERLSREMEVRQDEMKRKGKMLAQQKAREVQERRQRERLAAQQRREKIEEITESLLVNQNQWRSFPGLDGP